MKLSNIVSYRNTLVEEDFRRLHEQALKAIEGAYYHVYQQPAVDNNDKNELNFALENLNQAYKEITKNVDVICERLNQTIADREIEAYRESTRIWRDEMYWEKDENILSRRLNLSEEEAEKVKTMSMSANPKIPGLIFRPGVETWIDNLVSFDPLYVVDRNLELLRPAVEKFHPVYQRRLRTYTVDEYSEGPLLAHLPQGQFGFCFAYNFFNYKPIEVIERYIKELWKLMRVGGTVFMTYNNCDRSHAVALNEVNFMCYTPGRRVKQLVESVGFEIVEYLDGNGDLSYITFKKPGELSSLRGGQTLAKIIPK